VGGRLDVRRGWGDLKDLISSRDLTTVICHSKLSCMYSPTL
jgi:hypothetical protein